MRNRLVWLAGVLVFWMCAPGWAQPMLGGSAAPTSEPAKSAAAVAVEDQLMPQGRLQGLPLDEVLSFLNEKVPTFNSVVVRAPNTPKGYPTIQDFTPRNVTIGQFLEFVKTSFPGVTIQQIDGRQGPLYAVHVSDPTMAAGFGSPGFVPGMPADSVGAAVPAPTDGPIVKVYRLDDIVAALAADKSPADSRKTLDDVLSLIQAALDQAGAKDSVVLKVHEPTQTLVFKGSPSNMAVLEQVLDTLQPKWATAGGLGGGRGGPGTDVGGLNRVLSNLDRQNKELARQVMELNAAMAHVRETMPTTRPKD